jgi:tetrahydromethanopterin S-methyltransferase subunit G
MDDRLDNIEDRLNRIEEHTSKMNCELGQLMGQQHAVELILKYVVTPLLIIVGALAGINLA